MIDLSEYRLETIRKDDEFILYSGTRQTDATASSIFVLTPALEHPAVASLRGIEHEYSLQAELDPDWAVIPIGLVKHDGRTMLVLVWTLLAATPQTWNFDLGPAPLVYVENIAGEIRIEVPVETVSGDVQVNGG